MDESKKMNKVDVIISGKVITLTATESEAYMRMLAKYIDEKISYIQGSKSGFSMSSVNEMILISINIADDMFKERQKVYSLDTSLGDSKKLIDEKEIEISKLKERIIGLSKDNQALATEINSLQNELEYIMKSKQQELEYEKNRAKDEVNAAKQSFKQEVDRLKQTLAVENEGLRNALNAYESDKEEIISAYEKRLNELSDTYESELRALKSEHEQKRQMFRNALDEAAERLSASKTEKAELELELTEAKNKLEEAKKELNDFIDGFDIQNTEDDTAKGNVVDFLKLSQEN